MNLQRVLLVLCVLREKERWDKDGIKRQRNNTLDIITYAGFEKSFLSSSVTEKEIRSLHFLIVCSFVRLGMPSSQASVCMLSHHPPLARSFDILGVRRINRTERLR